jgi:hypothetical protein
MRDWDRITFTRNCGLLRLNKVRRERMSEKEKTAKEMGEELNLCVLLKEKEIEFLERMIENGIKFIPQEERKLTINMFDEMIQEKKKELEVVQGMMDL